MKKEVKRRAIECAAAAVLYIVAIVGSSYAELEREMRLLIFLLPYLIMVFATVRLLWNNLKKRKLFDENLLILLGHSRCICSSSLFGGSGSDAVFPDWKAAGTYFHEQDEKIY